MTREGANERSEEARRELIAKAIRLGWRIDDGAACESCGSHCCWLTAAGSRYHPWCERGLGAGDTA